ncbi:hypothetical protein CRM22_002573 [Opisthorchis felineus]|uniref:Actin interacting protein 3-like C-terminal domain-containing protein n=1 Tax=Opisthorchis felineus TaxID=147828 RepID=A0A4S2M9V1_OPIFE|nr:hypothetical protein CRM22_002573 [Opisthorchis felineus]TGZ71549.1 hypothetical protein CRM22_002573 [Opisthorchis felineus]
MMDPVVKPKSLPAEKIPTVAYNEQTLTTMDTATKVTNSLLSSVNPTPVPCGQCSTVQSSINSAMHVAHLAQSGHVILSGSKPTHAIVHGTGLPALVDPIHLRALTPTPGVMAAAGLREVQTLPRSADHAVHGLGARYRPILLANSQGTLTRLPSAHIGQTYQMIAYPNQLNPSSGQSAQKTAATGNTATGAAVMLAGLLAPEGASIESGNATRIAQLLSPAGLASSGMANTQLLMYYPQSNVNTATSGKQATASGEEQGSHPQQTVYYAVATGDLVRQLQAHQANVHEHAQLSRAQLLQTPSGLVLLQPNVSLQSAMSCSFKMSTQPPKSLPTESSTLPRQSRSEGGQTSGGLICTCPPEVHQAISEQQRRQKQQQQSQPQQRLHSHDRPPVTGPKSSEVPVASEMKTGAKTVHKPTENGGIMRPSEDSSRSIGARHSPQPVAERSGDTCCPTTHVNHSEAPPVDASPEDKAEKEAHVNYLVTLFQALKASGVQPESFVAAFKRTELPVPIQGDKTKQLILKNKAELEDCRRSIISLRQLHSRFQREVSEELSTCREQTVRLLKEYKTQLCCYSDPTLRSIRTDRASLDRMLTELREARTSLGEQLHDLECVIEQTGNDVLQHRCRITLPYVQTLDVRLDSISRAVGSTSATYPDIRQRLSKQEEAELRAIDMEKRVLDEQLHQLEDMGEKCKRIKGTILTLRRLAIVNGQNRQQASSPRRFAHLGGVMNRAAADPNSLERTRLYAAIKAIQPNSERRMQAIQRQETLSKQRKRVLALEGSREMCTAIEVPPTAIKTPFLPDNSRQVGSSGKQLPSSRTGTLETKAKPTENYAILPVPRSVASLIKEEKRAPLAVYSDDSLSSNTTVSSTMDNANLENIKTAKVNTSFNPGNVVCMIDDTSDSTLENQPLPVPAGILKASVQAISGTTTLLKPINRPSVKGNRGVMFSTTVTVDDGSEVVRLNCTLDESELGKNKVPPTEKHTSSTNKSVAATDKFLRTKSPYDRILASTKFSSRQSNARFPGLSASSDPRNKMTSSEEPPTEKPSTSEINTTEENELEPTEDVPGIPAPPPRRSSQITNSSGEAAGYLCAPASAGQAKRTGDDHETPIINQSPNSAKRGLPLPISTDVNEVLTSPSE